MNARARQAILHVALCDCGAALVTAPEVLVGRCASCVKASVQRPSIFRDACRSGSGLMINGATVAVRGRCGCGKQMLTDGERDLGQCIDCTIEDERELRRIHDEACEPIQDTL